MNFNAEYDCITQIAIGIAHSRTVITTERYVCKTPSNSKVNQNHIYAIDRGSHFMSSCSIRGNVNNKIPSPSKNNNNNNNWNWNRNKTQQTNFFRSFFEYEHKSYWMFSSICTFVNPKACFHLYFNALSYSLNINRKQTLYGIHAYKRCSYFGISVSNNHWNCLRFLVR